MLYQITRFGVLNFHQIQALCEERCKKTNLYEALKRLLKSGMIERGLSPILPYANYRTSTKGRQAIWGEKASLPPRVRESDFQHCLRVADTLIQISRYENISGFATEHEIPLHEWKPISDTKIPDAVVQVTRDGRSYELAVEVEVHPKTWERSEMLLKKYEEAFKNGALCRGTLIICDETDILHRYQTLQAKMDDDVATRFLVIRGSDLSSLKTNIYGETRKRPGICAERRRTHSAGEIQYLPIKSISAPEIEPASTPIQSTPVRDLGKSGGDS